MEGARAAVSWSGGKDSALALYSMVRSGFTVEWLVVTVDSSRGVTTGHRVPVELVRAQARLAGLKLLEVELPGDLPPERVYRSRMLEALELLRSRGVEYIGHGDLFLWDMIEYKEVLARDAGLESVFPLVGIDSATLVEAVFSLGIGAVVVAVNPERLSRASACSEFDRRFAEGLPATVDRAGEYGEFHTFVYKHPLFEGVVRFRRSGFEDLGWKVVCRLEPL